MKAPVRYADAHCDISDNILYAYPEKIDHFESFVPEKNGWLPHQIDLQKIISSGIKLMVWSICPVDISDEKVKISSSFDEFLRHVDIYTTLLNRYSNIFTLILSTADLNESFLASNKIGVILHLEGMDLVQNVSDLQKVYSYGVRSFGLCGITSNHLAYSGTEHPENKKELSNLGKQILQELEKMRVAIDYAHLADGAFFSVAEISTKPIYVSHTNCREVHFDGQNMTDLQLKKITESDGLCGMSLFPLLLTGKDATIDDFIDHIKYAEQFLTEKNICIGSDFDGMSFPAMSNCPHIGEVQKVFDGLLSAGKSTETVNNIAFYNLYNYFKKVL